MWSVDRHGTKSFIEFVSTYLPDHPEHRPVCGNEARAQSECRSEKRDDDGFHFMHACPECGAEEDVFLNLAPERGRTRR
ncbi:hypothetical protein DEQ92_13115 [Haloferax sp. Atlit-6N]|nr:hypothetical protein DEQ92_13115 [Haloferax sp. Atlit-6N]